MGEKAGIAVVFLSGSLSVAISNICNEDYSNDSRGLVASCVGTHIFFSTAESSATDITCKLSFSCQTLC